MNMQRVRQNRRQGKPDLMEAEKKIEKFTGAWNFPIFVCLRTLLVFRDKYSDKQILFEMKNDE